MNPNSKPHKREPANPSGEAAADRLIKCYGAAAHTTHLRDSLKTAVEAGTVTPDTAKAILNWVGPDGRIDPPTERAAAITHDVLEQINFQVDVVVDAQPAAESAGASTKPPVQSPRPTASEPAKTNKTGRTRKKLSAAALSRAAKAWADKNPADAATLLWHNAAAAAELIAADAVESEEGQLLSLLLRTVSQRSFTHMRQLQQPLSGAVIVFPDGETRNLGGPQAALRVAARLPATSDHDIDGEPVSVLAAVRQSLGRDNREDGMLPASPRVQVIKTPEDRLPDVPPEQQEPQLVLPTMQRARRNRIGPAPWLNIFDRLGGQSMAPGVGAPLSLRLWIEALAWTPPAARDGRLVSVPLTVRDLRDALWPNGWRRGEQLPRLIEACRLINGLAAIEIPERRSQWAPVLFREYPSPSARLTDPVLLEIRLPPVGSAGAGARFDRSLARRLGLSSAPEYRAYLGLVDLWDRTLHRGVHPPADHTWPNLAPPERRALVFGADQTAGSLATLRSRQRDADRAFRRLEEAGVIELQEDRDGQRRWSLVRRDQVTSKR